MLLLDALKDLSRYVGFTALPYLDRVVDDVMLEIFLLIDIEDVLSMRRVSRRYYHLTHNPFLWKRHLRIYKGILPPLPPTPRHSLQKMLGIEAERHLARAISYNDNWNSDRPVAYNTDAIPLYGLEAVSMTVLPGGHYLVLSARAPKRNHFEIMIFGLDCHFSSSYSLPLGRMRIPTKAYNLQAKYMRLNGVYGIVVSFIRREFKTRQPGIDPSDYTDKYDSIDSPYPLRYECATYFIRLDHLEPLVDPRSNPGSQGWMDRMRSLPSPFESISTIRTHSRLDNVCLDEIQGEPFLTVLKHPETIIFRNLNKAGGRAVLTCARFAALPDNPHNILAIRVIPVQRQVLVVKRVDFDPQHQKPYIVVESFNIPPLGQEITCDHVEAVYLDDEDIWAVSICELETRYSYDDSIQTSLPSWMQRDPAPISVYCRTQNPQGLIYMHIPPTKLEAPPSPVNTGRRTSSKPEKPPQTHYYRVTDLRDVADFTFNSNTFETAFFLPGAGRALGWEVPRTDRTDAPALVNMWSFIPQEIEGDPYLGIRRDQNEVGNTRRSPPTRQGWFAPLEMEHWAWENLKGGVQAITWDENIGRVCISPKGRSEVYVVDFSKSPRETLEGQRFPIPVHKTVLDSLPDCER
ncbi:hypothetical protein JAAARDRAFT_28990 [Jaapia argillacea MUCL 33604]|uniref:F-box domain-containing protein n=1 Tax=Jaapia argillacea MUCL 33604 TaxID=933084 RepID=A0A067QA21_9AGAM|nr:hypothetical protein JAAARDRAFT_28990 [Jaapia argillacea MUCL 33604]